MIPGYLSASQLTTYLMCPAKYRLRYLEEAEPAFRSSALALGSAVHATLDWLHTAWREGQRPAWEAIAQTFEADWSAEEVLDLRCRADEDTTSLGKLGLGLLLTYVMETPPKGSKASEVPFEVELVHPRSGESLPVPLKGYLDLVEEDGTVVEFKVYARKPDQATLAANVQLSAYSYAQNRLDGARPKLRMDCLLKTKKPRLERIPIERTEADDARFFVIAKEVRKAVRAGAFPPRPDWPCKDCEYRYLCPAWAS
jgi:putative RecB family exonuclease